MTAFRALGSVSLAGEGGPLSGRSVQPRRVALLALLAAHPHHTLTREKLAAFLWPDCRGDQGRHRLSESLYVLRKDLGEETLVSEGDQIRMDPDRIDCDVVAFRRCLKAGNLEAAASLYAGPFLDGFWLKGADEFQRWAESERRSLADAYGRAVEALAETARRRNDLLECIQWWTRLAVHDPYNSRFALGLMHALAMAGDPGNAIHHAQEHILRLGEELGAEAPGEVLAFLESLKKGGGQASMERAYEAGGEEASGPAGLGGEVRWSPEAEPESTESESTGPSSGSSGGGRRLRALAWSAIIAALTLGAVIASLARERAAELLPNLVVVTPFENLTGDPGLDQIALDAATWMEEAILQVEGVEVVPGSFARDYAQEAALAGSANPVRAAAERSRAGWAVGARIQRRGDSLELRADIIDLSKPMKTQGVVEVGVDEKLNETLDRLARRVSGALAYEFDPWMGETEPGSQPLPVPPTLEAFREHRLGFEAFDRQEWADSYRHHMKAFALDTTVVRALVAAAYVASGDRVKDSLAAYANDRRHLLSSQAQRDLDLFLAIRAADWDEALRLIREMSRLNEGGYSSVLEAWFAMRVNLPRAAFESTERYDPDLEWRRGEAHLYWRYRAQALHMLGDFRQELREAGVSRERYPNNLDLLIAEVRSLAALGRIQEVWERLRLAGALAHPNDSVAVVAGTELRAHGYLQESMDVFDQAAEWLAEGILQEETGPRARALLARALYGAERWAEAREVVGAVLAESPDDLEALGMVGLAAARQGDSVMAAKVMGRLSGMPRSLARGEPLYLLASLSAVLGRPDDAMRLLRQAYAEGQPHGLRLHADMNLETLRVREDFQALLAPKG